MAENKAFLVPVVVDGTPEHDPSIPEKFRELQWKHLFSIPIARSISFAVTANVRRRQPA